MLAPCPEKMKQGNNSSVKGRRKTRKKKIIISRVKKEAVSIHI